MSNNAAPPLEPTLFCPDFEEKGFIKAMTGIHSEEHLKAHIHSVQNKAYDVSSPQPTRPLQLNDLHHRSIHIPTYATSSSHGKGSSYKNFRD